MTTTYRSRKPSKITQWPHKHEVWIDQGDKNKTTITIHRRKTPQGKWSFMVANSAERQGKRRFESYPTEPEAIAAADKLGRKLLKQNAHGALITNKQAKEYFEATEQLRPFNLPLLHTVLAVVHCLKLVGNLHGLRDAAELYHERLVTMKHSHKCPKCGTVWCHESSPTWTGEQTRKEHTCPNAGCNTEQWGIFEHKSMPQVSSRKSNP